MQMSLISYIMGAMKLAESLGTEIRVRRNKLNYSQMDLAGLAETDRSFISEVENGKRNMSMDTFVKLCRALEADPPKILDGALKRMRR